jgi:SAM-dependent methyltransferase
MWSGSRLLIAILFAVGAVATWPALPSHAQTPPAGQSTGAPVTDAQIYEQFSAWLDKQPAMSADTLDQYSQVLTGTGMSAAEADRRIQVVLERLQQKEKERWNRVLTAAEPRFNTKPNAFLVEMTRGLTPGKALDVGMGQGRNALYLAQQGWAVTGFDPADKAVAAAQEQATKLGVPLNALVLRDDQFDFGNGQWDLIVISYVGVREVAPRIYDALKAGGLVVVEAFHRDATKNGPIGSAVVFDTNELLKLFDRFRVLRYEDAEGTADFGLRSERLVRLCAQKP